MNVTPEVLRVETQHQLELAQLDAGARRYWEDWNRQDKVGRPESDLLKELFSFHLRRIERLQRRMARAPHSGTRIPATLRGLVLGARATELTGITLLVPVTTCFTNAQAGSQPLTNMAHSIASAVRRSLVIDEAMYHWKDRLEQVKHITAEWDYQKAYKFLQRLDLNPERWPHKMSMDLGYFLLRETLTSNLLFCLQDSKPAMRNALNAAKARNHNGLRSAYQTYHVALQERGLFDLYLHPSKGKTVAKMGFTPQASEKLVDGHISIQDLKPAYGPMVCEPVPWTNDTDGGYILLRNPLVKPVRGNFTDPGTNDKIREAVNTLQRTKWTVDERVLEAVDYMFNTLGGDRAGLPSREIPEMPKHDGSTSLKEVKLKRKLIWDDWYDQQSQRFSIIKTLSEARRLLKYEPFYFAWSLDFRGRMYPMADALSPQGADYQKGMMVFHEAKSVDTNDWLLVNLANLYGVDKVSFEDRKQWARNHQGMLRRIGQDWKAHLEWWAEAGKPFAFLAAALDYADWQATGKSRIPVCMDGSCNGIQHLAALGRDLTGAKSTNLVDSEVPNDIYGDVAAELIPLIESSDSPYRQLFPPGSVTRKLVKRATMTTPYGVTRQGVRTQYITDGHLKDIPKEMQSEVSSWLTDLTTEAISRVVRSASEVMEWLKSLAREANKQGKALVWTSPDGKRVTQEYLKKDEKTLRILGMGKVTIKVASRTGEINKHNQINGTAPNIVHTFDGTHGRMYIIRIGDCDIAFVHDSVGTHACDVDRMITAIRETFVELHKEPILELLKEEVEGQLDITLGPPPIVGTLDLSLVSASRYFFA